MHVVTVATCTAPPPPPPKKKKKKQKEEAMLGYLHANGQHIANPNNTGNRFKRNFHSENGQKARAGFSVPRGELLPRAAHNRAGYSGQGLAQPLRQFSNVANCQRSRERERHTE